MNDRTEAITGTLADALAATDNSIFKDEVSDGQSQQQIIPKFVANKLLFMFLSLDFVKNVKELSSEDTEYGILPYPKLTEDQEDYAHLVSAYQSQFFCVPYYIEDPERTGIISETLAWASMNYLTPAYYEKTLVGTYVRDEESGEMLDLIFASRSFDMGPIFSWGDIMECYWVLDTNYASRFDQKLDGAKIALEEFLENLEDNDLE
jgi:hypothetical protein